MQVKETQQELNCKVVNPLSGIILDFCSITDSFYKVITMSSCSTSLQPCLLGIFVPLNAKTQTYQHLSSFQTKLNFLTAVTPGYAFLELNKSRSVNLCYYWHLSCGLYHLFNHNTKELALKHARTDFYNYLKWIPVIWKIAHGNHLVV